MRNVMKEKYVYGKWVLLLYLPQSTSKLPGQSTWCTEVNKSLYSTLQHPVTDYLHPLKPADWLTSPRFRKTWSWWKTKAIIFISSSIARLVEWESFEGQEPAPPTLKDIPFPSQNGKHISTALLACSPFVSCQWHSQVKAWLGDGEKSCGTRNDNCGRFSFLGYHPSGGCSDSGPN